MIFTELEKTPTLSLLKEITLTVLLLTGLGLNATITQTEPDTDTTKKVKTVDLLSISLSDDPYVARLDSLLNFNLFVSNTTTKSTEAFKVSENDTSSLPPNFADDIYEKRLAELDNQTPFQLDFNPEVKRYIDVYSLRRREQVSRMLGLAEYYFPMFEEALDKWDLPLELKYLAIVESALNPHARSRVGATGLWQFMYATGKLQGLTVTSYIDERNDPLKSTEAACKYLNTLYGIFGDWNLALAAYNSGPGNVNKAIRRSGGKRSYWEIRPYLPRETAGYVPAFIAVNYIMNHAADHKIYPTGLKPSFFTTDTVTIREQISFDQISALIDISKEELEFLNPGYRHKVIPKNEKTPYVLILPSYKMGMFIANEDSIYTIAKKDFEQNKAKMPAKEIAMDQKVYHKVRRGEVLGTIAERYGVSVSSVKRWNGLRGNTIRVGQRLAIYPRKMQPVASSSKSPVTKSSTDAKGNYQMYKVRNGETFYSIAKKYPGISAQNIMDWNNIRNARSLKVGMNLKIYPNS